MSNKRKLTRRQRQELGQTRIVNDKFEMDRRAPVVVPKNGFQSLVLESLKTKQVIVVIGSAGVGKSFLTMSHTSDSLYSGKINKVYLSRPAVGMGNTVGLLKGGLRDKYEPYLMPLVEVITERYGKGKYETALSAGNLEFIPLEYLRGRNFKGVAVVDEAQNTTPNEMYSIVTRLTDDGQLIILGDKTQTDIEGENGLEWLEKFIDRHNLHDIMTVLIADSDYIVRGDVCKRVVKTRESELNRKNIKSVA